MKAPGSPGAGCAPASNAPLQVCASTLLLLRPGAHVLPPTPHPPYACLLPATRSKDLATFAEAIAGKPSHLLEGDTLKQFLSNGGKVLRFW